jgi:hypothetical protein
MANHLNDMDHALQQKLESYEDFLSATLLLKKALETEEMTAVNHLIERREELIGIIDGLDRRFSRHLQTLGSDHGPVISERMSKMSEGLSKTLERILSADQDCGILVAGKCDAMRKELNVIRHKKEGLQGYAPKTGRMVQFLDTRT